MKIALTGGHLTPAIAFIQEANKHQAKILFLGRKYASTSSLILSREKSEVENLGAQFLTITTPKLSRHQKLNSLIQAGKLPFSVISALSCLKQFQPHVLITFGGHIAVPAAIAARILNIPLIIHEQTHEIGLANRLVSPLAVKIAVSYQTSEQFFPATKVILTGNLIRQAFTDNNLSRPTWLPRHTKPILYITGGNQGSLIINQTVKQILPALTRKFVVIHQCGASKVYQYFTSLSQAKLSLPPSQQSNYFVREWLLEAEVAWILKHSKLVIARSGANTTTELLFCKTPALLIPLAIAQKQEQYKNAQYLANLGLAQIIPQNQLTPKNLKTAISHPQFEPRLSPRLKQEILLIKSASHHLYQLANQVTS